MRQYSFLYPTPIKYPQQILVTANLLSRHQQSDNTSNPPPLNPRTSISKPDTPHQQKKKDSVYSSSSKTPKPLSARISRHQTSPLLVKTLIIMRVSDIRARKLAVKRRSSSSSSSAQATRKSRYIYAPRFVLVAAARGRKLERHPLLARAGERERERVFAKLLGEREKLARLSGACWL